MPKWVFVAAFVTAAGSARAEKIAVLPTQMDESSRGKVPELFDDYVLTAVHGAHLLAGVLVLFYVLSLAMRYRLTPGESSSPSLAATYWHFVDGLWLYLLVVLFYL